jgi:hypothetical protein
MRDISSRLDATWTRPPNSGGLDLGAYVRGGMEGGIGGGSLSVEHRWDRASVFAEGWAGLGWGDQYGFQYGGLGGLRMRW